MGSSPEAIEMTDSQAVESHAMSERGAAFLRLADEHLDAAYRLARAILGDRTEAQDVTHDAVVQAWRKWPSLRDPARFEAWFDRILVNLCRDRLRRTTRWQATDISTEVALAAGDPLVGTHDRDLLETALARPPPGTTFFKATQTWMMDVDDRVAAITITSYENTPPERLAEAVAAIRSIRVGHTPYGDPRLIFELTHGWDSG